MPFSVPGFSPGYHIACCVLSPRCPLTVAFTVWKVAGDPCAPVRTRCVISQTNQERFTCSLCGIAQVNRRAWGPQRPPILSIATEEDREAGQCLGNGQAFFVFLQKGSRAQETSSGERDSGTEKKDLLQRVGRTPKPFSSVSPHSREVGCGSHTTLALQRQSNFQT